MVSRKGILNFRFSSKQEELFSVWSKQSGGLIEALDYCLEMNWSVKFKYSFFNSCTVCSVMTEERDSENYMYVLCGYASTAEIALLKCLFWATQIAIDGNWMIEGASLSPFRD